MQVSIYHPAITQVGRFLRVAVFTFGATLAAQPSISKAFLVAAGVGALETAFRQVWPAADLNHQLVKTTVVNAIKKAQDEHPNV